MRRHLDHSKHREMKEMKLLLVSLVFIWIIATTDAFATLPTLHRSSGMATTTQLFVDGQGMAGGNRHWMGDILRSLEPRYLSQVAESVQSNLQGMPSVDGVETFCAALESSVPTWDALQTDLDKFDSSLSSSTEAAPSAKATMRLFGHEEPVLTFYRDSAAWCPYCQKVWIALEEARIPYQVVKIDMRCYGDGQKPTEFLNLQPNGNLPCAVVNTSSPAQTSIIGESNDIIDALDELVVQLEPKRQDMRPPLRPKEQEEQIRDLCDNGRDSLERRLYSRWMWWLTGVRRPQEYQDLFLEHWQEMEDALQETSNDGPYFLGRDISVVDIRFIPFVERQLASLTYFKGADYLRDAKQYPNIVRWLEAMESRPSYQATKSDFYTHSRALPPQLAADCAGDSIQPERVAKFQAAIDYLPSGLGESSTIAGDDENFDWIEPGWEWYSGNAYEEAAHQVLSGGARLAAFAARGAGTAGWPAASAPLADPSATPHPDLVAPMDIVLRYIVSSLLAKAKAPSQSWLVEPKLASSGHAELRVVVSAALKELPAETEMALASCLDYLRARIGVPRDLSFPAAQVLRRELLQLRQLEGTKVLYSQNRR